MRMISVFDENDLRVDITMPDFWDTLIDDPVHAEHMYDSDRIFVDFTDACDVCAHEVNPDFIETMWVQDANGQEIVVW